MSAFADRPKVSVCVTTYNHRKYIKDCLLSVLMQSCDADLEILVGDDCSTDETGEIIRQVSAMFPGRITAPARERNLGACDNCRDLIARATGQYIAMLDGDDYWLPGKLAAQLEYAAKHPECAAVYTNAYVVSDTGEFLGLFNNRQPEVFDTDYLLARNFLNFSSLLFRAEFRDALLGMSGDFIDYRVHLRLSRRGPLGYVNRQLLMYRAASATSMIKNVPGSVRSLYWEALCDPEISRCSKKSVRRGKAYHWGTIVYSAVLAMKPSDAWGWISRIRRETPRGATRVFLAGTLTAVALIFRVIFRKLLKIIDCQRARIFYGR
jgi:glycosyltransferase involved in cell wall biosynthesis